MYPTKTSDHLATLLLLSSYLVLILLNNATGFDDGIAKSIPTGKSSLPDEAERTKRDVFLQPQQLSGGRYSLLYGPGSSNLNQPTYQPSALSEDKRLQILSSVQNQLPANDDEETRFFLSGSRTTQAPYSVIIPTEPTVPQEVLFQQRFQEEIANRPIKEQQMLDLRLRQEQQTRQPSTMAPYSNLNLVLPQRVIQPGSPISSFQSPSTSYVSSSSARPPLIITALSDDDNNNINNAYRPHLIVTTPPATYHQLSTPSGFYYSGASSSTEKPEYEPPVYALRHNIRPRLYNNNNYYAEESETSTEQHQDLSKVPGEPGVDYPTYHSVPETRFSCNSVPYLPGMYANMETGCQAYHVCHDGREGHQGAAFLCGNGTLFNQKEFACDWWYNVDCKNAASHYELNGDVEKNPFTPKVKDKSQEESDYYYQQQSSPYIVKNK